MNSLIKDFIKLQDLPSYDILFKKIYSEIYGPKYQIENFDIVLSISDDKWNGIHNEEYHYSFYYNNKQVGTFFFRTNGQIGILRLDKEFQGWGIGKEIINLMKDKIKTDKVWCVTTKNHPFWKNRNNSIWKENIHPSVTSPGYEFNL